MANAQRISKAAGARRDGLEEKRAFLKLLPACRYNVSRACREMGLRRSDYSRWLRDDAAFRRAVGAHREEILDFFEEELLKRVIRGDGAALIFALSTLGARRGYGNGNCRGNCRD